MLKKKLLEELERYRSINRYTSKLMNEQEVPPDPAAGVPPDPAAGVPPDPAAGVPPAPDAGVPPAPDAGVPPVENETEEVDITDLVNIQKSIKKDIENNKNENSGIVNKMDDVFTKLTDLENKLSQMDQLFNKIEQLGSKVDSMREKTPEEKLELRSLDSYPFNENPQQFFAKKQGDMQMSGKNQYILKKSDIENYSTDEIRTSFNPNETDEYSY